MKSRLGDQRGAALLLVIVTISILVILTVRIIADVNQQMEEADSAQNAAIRMNLFDSGLHVAQAALYADQLENNFDSLLDNWATLNTNETPLFSEDTKVTITVHDLSGRLQVNSLANLKGTAAESAKSTATLNEIHEIWTRFLLSGHFAIENEEEAKNIVDAISDWIDADDTPREYGAESEYYHSLAPAYSCQNGAIHTMEELLLIKGITPGLLYGDSEHEGISTYITTSGHDGKININTAPAVVIQAMHEELTDDMITSVINYRTEPEHQEDLQNKAWYHTLAGVPADVVIPVDLLTVQSTYFEIEISVETPERKDKATGIVHRSSDKQQKILSWYD